MGFGAFSRGGEGAFTLNKSRDKTFNTCAIFVKCVFYMYKTCLKRVHFSGEGEGGGGHFLLEAFCPCII